MNFIQKLIPPFKFNRAEDPDKVELRKRVATLEIQCGRIKEERDLARGQRDAARGMLSDVRMAVGIMT